MYTTIISTYSQPRILLLTSFNIGDSATVVKNNKTKTIHITGFWKFEPFSESGDEFANKIINNLIEDDISNGSRKREERIIPCLQEEAQLISTNHSFYDVLDIKKSTLEPLLNADFHKGEHEHHLAMMKEHGEMCVYGRIKLPVDDYPRFFNSKGKLNQ